MPSKKPEPEPKRRVPQGMLAEAKGYKETVEVAQLFYQERVTELKEEKETAILAAQQAYDDGIKAAVEEHDAIVAAARMDLNDARRRIAPPTAGDLKKLSAPAQLHGKGDA